MHDCNFIHCVIKHADKTHLNKVGRKVVAVEVQQMVSITTKLIRQAEQETINTFLR